jgi:hypothetical protein
MKGVMPVSGAAVLLAVAACAGLEGWLGRQAAAPALVPFTSVAHGASSGIAESGEIVVDSAQTWRALWARHAPGTSPPSVDFTTEVIVGVLAGERSSARYEVDIVAIERHSKETTVVYRVSDPQREELVGETLMAPFHLARLPRQLLPIRFEQQ